MPVRYSAMNKTTGTGPSSMMAAIMVTAATCNQNEKIEKQTTTIYPSEDVNKLKVLSTGKFTCKHKYLRRQEWMNEQKQKPYDGFLCFFFIRFLSLVSLIWFVFFIHLFGRNPTHTHTLVLFLIAPRTKVYNSFFFSLLFWIVNTCSKHEFKALLTLAGVFNLKSRISWFSFFRRHRFSLIFFFSFSHIL